MLSSSFTETKYSCETDCPEEGAQNPKDAKRFTEQWNSIEKNSYVPGEAKGALIWPVQLPSDERRYSSAEEAEQCAE